MAERGSSHISAQKAGKLRDGYTCQMCGDTIKPEGHHIIDHQYGGSSDTRNIVTLCKACHLKVHHRGLTLVSF